MMEDYNNMPLTSSFTKRKKRRRSSFGNTIGSGVTALIGIGLLSATADAVRRVGN